MWQEHEVTWTNPNKNDLVCTEKNQQRNLLTNIVCVCVLNCVRVCVYIYACVFQHQEQGQLQECVSAVRVCLTRLDHVIKVHETNQPPITPLLLSPFFALLLLLPSFPHHSSSFLSLLLFTLNLSSSLSLPLIFCSVRLVLAHYWSSWPSCAAVVKGTVQPRIKVGLSCAVFGDDRWLFNKMKLNETHLLKSKNLQV